MDIKKNKLQIGKVRVDVYPKPSKEKDAKNTSNKIVTLKPDPDQSDESKKIALNFLNNVFKTDSNYGSGLFQFKLNDPQGWKKKYSNKFIKAITNSDINISWTGDYEAIKGLKALLPKGTQFNFNHGIELPGNTANPMSNPWQGISPDIGQNQQLPSSLSGGLEDKGIAQQDKDSTIPPPENASYIYDMKNLIQLWEKVNHEI